MHWPASFRVQCIGPQVSVYSRESIPHLVLSHGLCVDVDLNSWHADNSSRGLTVIMALSDITPTHGPTQIWPYAHSGAVVHAVRHGPLPSACVADGDGLGVQGTNATYPTLHAGDALVFDARMLHRGLANRSDDLRPVIVWQFTNVATPPPGQGAVVSLTKHAYMRILEALHAGLKRIEGGK